MLVNEDLNRWSSIIKEDLGVTDNTKLGWMSQYARIHEIYESNGNPAMPLNTMGLGNPMLPNANTFNLGSGIGNTGSDFHSPTYIKGSGDVPISTLSIALEVAATTIAFELVPVIPSQGPLLMLQYADFPYAGGKLGRINETILDGKGVGDANKPIYVKVLSKQDDLVAFYSANTDLVIGTDKIEFKNDTTNDELKGVYMGKSRIDGGIIVKVETCADTAGTTPKSISEVITGTIKVGKTGHVTHALTTPVADIVSATTNHIQGFSNFFDGSEEPMTRAQNETGLGNTIGVRFFSKMVQMGSFEVTGAVTRQQLQDLPMYGIDVIGQLITALQNELSQSINNRLLDRMFKLGVSNARLQKSIDNIDLNLYIAGAGAPPTKDLKDFANANLFVGIDNQNASTTWGAIKNATKNTAAENVYTHQRRIMSRILAASNLIANASRFGRADWVVVNTQILTALQDTSQFVIAPMANDLAQDKSKSLYFAGSIAGLAVYCDPNMTWNDTRVLVGRKSDGKTPGVVFSPYILADQIQVTAEGTMSPKILLNSRFAIVDLGFNPELNYFCFMIDSDEGMIL